MFKIILFIATWKLISCVTKAPTPVLTTPSKTIGPQNDLEIHDMLKVMLKNYDQKLRPNYLGKAVDVTVDATVMTISKIDEVNMMFTLDMFFRQRWNDHRLRHDMNETLTLICGTKQPADIIWVPDTVFIDSVTSNMHKVTVNNHKIDIFPNGDVFWGTRVTVSPSCPLNLRAYPMDKQMCPFVILSYAYTSRHLKYQWLQNPGIKANNIRMAQFKLVKYKTERKEISYVAGNYTQLKGVFYFDRLMGFAIMQIYVPSVCVVMVSWVSLWVQRQAIPARVALCITTLLTISSFWSAINAQLPRVNYVKAIDIFMLTSFTCVIMTLIEFTFVLNSAYVWKVIKPKQTKKVSHEMGNLLNNANRFSLIDSKGNPWPINNVDKAKFRHTKASEKLVESNEKDAAAKDAEAIENVANKIENTARLFFPLTYALFLAGYFFYYLGHTGVSQEQ